MNRGFEMKREACVHVEEKDDEEDDYDESGFEHVPAPS